MGRIVQVSEPVAQLLAAVANAGVDTGPEMAALRCAVCGQLAGSADLSVSARVFASGAEVVYAHLACAGSQRIDQEYDGDPGDEQMVTVWQVTCPWVRDDGELLELPTLVLSASELSAEDGYTLGASGLVAVTEPVLPPEAGWQVKVGPHGTLAVHAGPVALLDAVACDDTWSAQAVQVGRVVVVWCAVPLPTLDPASDVASQADWQLGVLAAAGLLAGTCAPVSTG